MTSEQATTKDPRFTVGLMFDVFAVLGQHGFEIGEEDRCYADAGVALFDLVRAYEGKEAIP